MSSFTQICLGIFAMLALAHGSTDPVDDSSSCSADGEHCGASGTMLLKVSSSTKRISWPEPEANQPYNSFEDNDQPETLALTSVQDRMQALSDSSYDSDDDNHADAPAEFDGEFVDDDDYNVAALTDYVASNEYDETADASFSPDVWNQGDEIRASHNCYMYALNDLSPRSYKRCQQTLALIEKGDVKVSDKDKPKVCRRYFHKPGYYFQNFVSGRAQTDTWYRDETTCRLMLPMLAADSPNIVWNNDKNKSLTEDDSCPENHYMAALFIQPKAGFHFYRRDHACGDDPEKLCWSHKPGIMKATDKDASGHKITSVMKADRDYGGLNYHENCALFCVPQNSHLRTHSDSKRALEHAK